MVWATGPGRLDGLVACFGLLKTPQLLPYTLPGFDLLAGLMETSLVLGHETVELCPQWVTWPVSFCELEQRSPLWTSMRLLSTLSQGHQQAFHLHSTDCGLFGTPGHFALEAAICSSGSGRPRCRTAVHALCLIFDHSNSVFGSSYLSTHHLVHDRGLSGLFPLIGSRSTGLWSKRRSRHGSPWPCVVLSVSVSTQQMLTPSQ